MKKMLFLALILLMGWSCIKEQRLTPADPASENGALSIDEAKVVIYEKIFLATRSTSPALPFVLGEMVLDWQRAEASQDYRISTVDVPIAEEITYTVFRKNIQEELYAVEASSKLIAVKEFDTEETQAYIRTCIPDEGYEGPNEEKICDLSLNCGERGGFSGLEIYSTLDGHLVAVAKYTQGVCETQLYLCDESLSVEEKINRFTSLFSEVLIVPSSTRTRSSGVDTEEWPYGPPNSCFIGNDGTLYIYVDNDGDGVSDSIMDYRSWLIMTGGGSGGGSSSNGGDSSGNNGGSSEGGSGNGGTPGGGEIGGGSGGGGGGGNNSGENPEDENDGSDDDGEGDDSGGGGIGDKMPISGETSPRGGNFTPINPLPDWDRLPPTLPPDDEEDDEYYTRLGEEAFAKIRADIESGNYLFYDCVVDNSGNVGEALLVATGVGLNTNDFILSFMEFFDNIPKDALDFGKKVSVLNMIVGTAQTIIGCSDGDITTADALNAISTILGAAGHLVALTPLFPVAPYLGIASCVVGLASNCFTYYGMPTIIRVKMDNGDELNILIC